MAMQKTLGVAEAAEVLGCTEGTLRQWCSRRKLPFLRVGRLVRFSPEDLSKFLDGCRVAPAVEQRFTREPTQ